MFPFNPDRVLRDTPKPPAELTIPQEANLGASPQHEVLKTPVTPVTPVTTEALVSLHDMIKHNAYALDQTNAQRLQRHVQKLASAAKVSFAERALLQDRNRFLSKMNNEAKVRRSTKSEILGKAKVMKYEDLEEARAKRATKVKAAEDKAKRGRKRKTCVQEEDAPDSKTKAARASEADLANALVMQISEAPAPWRAPVAQMLPRDYERA